MNMSTVQLMLAYLFVRSRFPFQGSNETCLNTVAGLKAGRSLSSSSSFHKSVERMILFLIVDKTLCQSTPD